MAILITQPAQHCEHTSSSEALKERIQTSRTPASNVEINLVLESAEYAYKACALSFTSVYVYDFVQVNDRGVESAARLIRKSIISSNYTPRTWRTHPLHICPPEDADVSEKAMAKKRLVLDWIFLISSLNFSFWSEKEEEERYAVDWYETWEEPRVHMKRWTGYWSLVAALDRALSEDIPITDPSFYASEAICPDSVIEHVFRAASDSKEDIPLLQERIEIMRQVGSILCSRFGGHFQGFLDEFHRRHHGAGNTLDLVCMVVETFPTFRDEVRLHGRKVQFWKRAQILVAEIWAAFHPLLPSDENFERSHPHPIFPSSKGPCIHLLTMFADYRVPQILHHLQILTYSPKLMKMLQDNLYLAYGSPEEVSLRAASIVAVEKVRKVILRLAEENAATYDTTCGADTSSVSSVLIDFFLWDLAKRVESGEEEVEGADHTANLAPIHRTRSIWY